MVYSTKLAEDLGLVDGRDRRGGSSRRAAGSRGRGVGRWMRRAPSSDEFQRVLQDASTHGGEALGRTGSARCGAQEDRDGDVWGLDTAAEGAPAPDVQVCPPHAGGRESVCD